MLFNPRIVTGSKPSKTFKAAENQSYWPKIKKKKIRNIPSFLQGNLDCGDGKSTE